MHGLPVDARSGTARLATALALLFAVGCQPGERSSTSGGWATSGSGASSSDGGGGESGGTEGSGGSSDGGGGPGTGPTSSGDGDGDGDGDVRFDVGGDGESGGESGGGQRGCQKIDFLFVIDNSGSMQAHQANLRSNFGPFIQAIVDNVQAQDYQIMVVDSDASPGSSSTSSGGSCAGFCGACDPGARCVCNGETCGGSCEHELGGGKTGNGTCDVPENRRYLTGSADAAAIAATFECVASRVGTNGSGNELPMSAMVEAITTLNGPGRCNEGFVRDDAVLVVTIISDDHRGWVGNDDSTTVGEPQQWYDAVVGAKGGRPENVVVLGLFGEQDLAPAGCLDGDNGEAFSNPKFLEFVELFGDRGYLASVCETDYLPVFSRAVPAIDETCEDFVPPG